MVLCVGGIGCSADDEPTTLQVCGNPVSGNGHVVWALHALVLYHFTNLHSSLMDGIVYMLPLTSRYADYVNPAMGDRQYM